MGAYLGIHIDFRFYVNNPNLVENLHKLYRKYGFKEEYAYSNNDVSVEEIIKTNQKCFDERILFNEHKHYRTVWSGELTSFMETFPNISFDDDPEYPNKMISAIRQEWLLFPEDEITPSVFQKILELITDLYNMEDVYSVKIQKEE